MHTILAGSFQYTSSRTQEFPRLWAAPLEEAITTEGPKTGEPDLVCAQRGKFHHEYDFQRVSVATTVPLSRAGGIDDRSECGERGGRWAGKYLLKGLCARQKPEEVKSPEAHDGAIPSLFSSCSIDLLSTRDAPEGLSDGGNDTDAIEEPSRG